MSAHGQVEGVTAAPLAALIGASCSPGRALPYQYGPELELTHTEPAIYVCGTLSMHNKINLHLPIRAYGSDPIPVNTSAGKTEL